MGRCNTGSQTTSEVRRIEMKDFIKWEVFKYERNISFPVTWNDNNSIKIYINHDHEEIFIKLKYTLTDNQTGNKLEMNYRIEIKSIPSNIGNGNIYFFICPVTRERCKVLYQAYGSNIFKSRKAYENRIYYPTQIASKKGIYRKRSLRVKERINKMQSDRKRQQEYFKGKRTKYSMKLEELQNKAEELDLRNTILLLDDLGIGHRTEYYNRVKQILKMR